MCFSFVPLRRLNTLDTAMRNLAKYIHHYINAPSERVTDPVADCWQESASEGCTL